MRVAVSWRSSGGGRDRWCRWRRAQIVLWSANRMDVPAIAKIVFTSEDRVRAVIHNFNDDGFDSLTPKYAGGRPPTFTLPQRQEIKERSPCPGRPIMICRSRRGRLSKLAEFLVAEGVVDDISHEGLRALLREEGVSFQVIKTFKVSNDPDFEDKKNRILELYVIADGTTLNRALADPTVVIRMDEFGPLNLQPHPGKQWAPAAAGKGDPDMPRRRRMRATYTRPHGVRHLMAGLRLVDGPALRPRRHSRSTHLRVLGVLSLPAFAAPDGRADRHRGRELQSPPVDAVLTPAVRESGRRRTTSSWPTPRSTDRG